MKEIIYYTCGTHADNIEQTCRTQLLKSQLPIISVSLNKEIDFGNDRIVVNGVRSPEMMHKQILAGLKASTAMYVFLCESDVLYHPSHFEFTPPTFDTFFYNTNVWKYHTDNKKFYWTDDMQQVSGCAASRELMISFFERRLKQFELTGFDRHYEPTERFGEYTKNWQSWIPNICIRHDKNLTRTKKSIADFKNKQKAKGWKEAEEVTGWGEIKI